MAFIVHEFEKIGYYPKFELNKSRFNLETYIGRFYHNIDLIDPRTLFASEETLQHSIKLLEDFKNGKLKNNTKDKDLWRAQKLKQSTIHPDINEKIPLPFRMAGFVPFNTPIMAGLLMQNPTIPQVLFFQCLNQTHCALVNYANRNATKPMKMSNFVQGYTGAVTAAASLSLGLNLALRRVNNLKPFVKNMLQRFVPIPAIVAASTLNVVLMRKHELDEGIDVMDKNGKVLGSSQLAASNALKEMAISRAVLGGSVMALPAILMTSLERITLLKRNPRLKTPFNLLICAASFALTLPASNAIFPQISKISTKELEIPIQQKTKDSTVFYNRGL